MIPLPPLLAHGSGIDDVLWFAVPALLGIAAIRVAERRARARAEAGAADDPDDGRAPAGPGREPDGPREPPSP